MLVKISALAQNYGVSRYTVYNWVTRGIVPEKCVVRLGASIRIDAERFAECVRRDEIRLPTRQGTRACSVGAEDSHTTAGPTVGRRDNLRHRWPTERHPYAPQARAETAALAAIERLVSARGPVGDQA